MEQEEFIQFLRRNTEVLYWIVVLLSVFCLGDSFHILSFSYDWLMILTKIVFGISSILLTITLIIVWKTWLKYLLSVLLIVVLFFGVYSVPMRGYELNSIYYSKKEISKNQQNRVEVFSTKKGGLIKYEKVILVFLFLEYRQEIHEKDMIGHNMIIWKNR